MKAIFTGLNGTVAPIVANYFREKGIEIVSWNRDEVSTSNIQEMKEFIEKSQPQFFLHFAMGDPDWAGNLAKICLEKKIKYLFVSTVSVFSEKHTGPYTTDSIPNAEEDYGKYKIACEKQVQSNNQEALIVRIGWQIGDTLGNNNMLEYIHRQVTEKGHLEASTQWFPSCSFMEDTAQALYDLMTRQPAGLYLVNGNLDLSFYDIVLGLKINYPWIEVQSTDTFVRDDRMFDSRVSIENISKHFETFKSKRG